MLKPSDIRLLRKGLRLTQKAFWGKIGIQATDGCQYEREQRPIPAPVMARVTAAYDTEENRALLAYPAPIQVADIPVLRERLKLTQKAFWGKLGVSQSLGATYEAGYRKIRLSIYVLFENVYGNKETIDAILAQPVPPPAIDVSNIPRLRKALGLSQREFWKKLGITQAHGSRYEAGLYKIPPKVYMLLESVYGDKATLDKNLACYAQDEQFKVVIPFDIYERQWKYRLDRTEFWQNIGVRPAFIQRYEQGLLRIPEPVALLLTLAYGERKNIESLLVKLRPSDRNEKIQSPINLSAIHATRKALGLSRRAFWAGIGITSETINDYHNGAQRSFPEYIRLLLILAYGAKKDANALLKKLRKYSDKRHGDYW